MSLAQQIARYERLPLPLVPELGRCTMTVREILALAPGSVITLPRAVGSKIEVRVGGALFGSGDLVSSAGGLTLRFSSFYGEDAGGKLKRPLRLGVVMEFSEQLLAVVLVLGVLGGALWVLKRKGLVRANLRRPRRADERRLEVIDRLALTPQHSVHLIRVADRTLLVGLSPGGCNLLESTPYLSTSPAKQTAARQDS